MDQMKICVILPALNEEKGIKKMIDSVPNPLVSKIVVVDGNSSDNTVNIAKKCKKSACDVQVMAQNGKGKGMAFQSFIHNFDLEKSHVLPAIIRKIAFPASLFLINGSTGPRKRVISICNKRTFLETTTILDPT